MTQLSTSPTPSLDAASELAALDQSARLTLRLVSNLNIAALRFSERQRLTRILRRLETVASEVQDIIPLAR